MKYILKLLLVILLISTIVYAESFQKPPYDKRLDRKVDGKLWYDNADTDYTMAYNLGVFYDQELKDYKLAELWYKKSWSIKQNGNAANNLGLIYEDKKQYSEAIKWYKVGYKLKQFDSAYNLGLLYGDVLHKYSESKLWLENACLSNNKNVFFSLGLLYENHFKNYKKATEWYEKAIERESLDAMKNLSLLYYHKLNDNEKAVEYFIPLIDKKYSKAKVEAFFKKKWKLSDETIKKGYEAQLKSTIIPEKLKYKGGI